MICVQGHSELFPRNLLNEGRTMTVELFELLIVLVFMTYARNVLG